MSKKKYNVTNIVDDPHFTKNHDFVFGWCFMDNVGYWIQSPIELHGGDTVYHGVAAHGDGEVYKIVRNGEVVYTGGQMPEERWI